MNDLRLLQGKTIGVVYTYEGEDASGFAHYHYWKSDIISQWLLAIQQLHCRPFILDVRTFTEKMLAGTMPHIDYVLNLNCGGCELSPMALIPSTCAFFRIPCIPCNSVAILTGENKRISNLLAAATGLNVPQELSPYMPDGIFRPLNLGSSIGVKRGPLTDPVPDGVYQEFIYGYDITTPVVYNPCTGDMDFMPTVLYVPSEGGVDWYLDDTNKDTRSGFERRAIFELSDELKHKQLELIKNSSIKTFCRIDSRIKCSSPEHLAELLNRPLRLEDVYFIELNPMPTVWINNALSYSFSVIQEGHSLYSYTKVLENLTKTCNVYNFLLSLSMLAYNQVQK